MFWSQDFFIRAGFEPVENWRAYRKVCFICRQYWCGCMHTRTLATIEEATTEMLQITLRDCFECGVEFSENLLVEALTHEIVHRRRYNLDPLKRFNGATKSIVMHSSEHVIAMVTGELFLHYTECQAIRVENEENGVFLEDVERDYLGFLRKVLNNRAL